MAFFSGRSPLLLFVFFLFSNFHLVSCFQSVVVVVFVCFFFHVRKCVHLCDTSFRYWPTLISIFWYTEAISNFQLRFFLNLYKKKSHIRNHWIHSNELICSIIMERALVRREKSCEKRCSPFSWHYINEQQEIKWIVDGTRKKGGKISVDMHSKSNDEGSKM